MAGGTRNLLRLKRLSEVSLVDAGANQKAHVAIWKRDVREGKFADLKAELERRVREIHLKDPKLQGAWAEAKVFREDPEFLRRYMDAEEEAKEMDSTEKVSKSAKDAEAEVAQLIEIVKASEGRPLMPDAEARGRIWKARPDLFQAVLEGERAEWPA